MKVRVEATLPLDAESYLLERDGAAFRSFMCEEMSLLEYEITECKHEGNTTVIRINSKPDVGAWIPSSLASSIPDKFEYWDEVRYDPKLLAEPPYELQVQSEAPFLGEKGHFESRIIIEPLGPDRCRHVLEQTIEIKGMWGLGAVAKKLAKKSLQDSFAEMPALLEKWLEVRKDLLQTPDGRARLLAGRPKVQGVNWMEEHEAAIQEHAAPPKKRGKAGRRHSRGRRAIHPAPEEGAAAAGAAPPAVPSSGADETPAPLAAEAAAASVHVPAPNALATAAAGASAAIGAEMAHEQAQQAGSNAARGQEEEQGGYQDTQEAMERQGTSGTAYFSPAASLVPGASGEALPLSLSPATEQDGTAVPAAGRPRVTVQRVDRNGLPLSADGAASSSDSESTTSSSSDEAEEEPREDWATSGPWRAYYHQRGSLPLRRNHSLPPKLVQSFIPKRRPQPVQAEKLNVPGSGSQRAARGAGGSRSRRSRGLCGLRGSTGSGVAD
ncbi:hypothetical protein D9Q98_008201 [Chlorella vulgaris]|uniref:Uncharacterized protein n=1 Tax=Chlorella vulgaris TaxID=3077 RepID=A0A9D4TGA1_CHLVU|nr:hypothetical protein D9Q98_008201 [Chlorella vulgaris]